MKKIFNFFAVALVALTTMSLASCEDNGDEPDGFKFVAPMVEWNVNVDAVNAFMSKNLPDFTNIREDSMKTDKGIAYTRMFYNQDKSVEYSYYFLNNELLKTTVFYEGQNQYFEAILSQMTTLFDIKKWEADDDEIIGENRYATNETKKTDYSIWNCTAESFTEVSISLIGYDFGYPIK